MRPDYQSIPQAVRGIASKLKATPLHPQWFAFFREDENLKRSCGELTGTVVDIGCADAKPRHYLPADAYYVGLDYFSTASDWYSTRPDVYGDARSLPFVSECAHHVLLLDVLEHIPNPAFALQEVHRILKSEGTFTIQVPFLYLIHDAPLDFHRWTQFALRDAAADCGFVVSEQLTIGHPLETAALNVNIALSSTAMSWIEKRNPLVLLIALLPLAVLINNISAWVFARLSARNDFMPYAYRMIWKKK